MQCLLCGKIKKLKHLLVAVWRGVDRVANLESLYASLLQFDAVLSLLQI